MGGGSARTVRWLAAAVIAATLALVLAAPGSAEIRTGAGSDPQDPSAAGLDVEQVRVVYDTAGTLSVTVRLYQPIAGDAGFGSFEITLGQEGTPSGCRAYGPAGGRATLTGYVGDLGVGELEPTLGNSVTVDGRPGTIQATKSFSADGYEIAYTASDPALAGRNYICADDISTYLPDPYGHCSWPDCTYWSYRYTYDEVKDFYLDGYRPHFPACGDWEDNDGDGKSDWPYDPGCENANDDDERDPPEPACSDGIDNDGDGRTDWPADNDCIGSSSDSEGAPRPPATPKPPSKPNVVCRDGIDNDHDGKVDLRDPGCRGSATGRSETDPRGLHSRTAVVAIVDGCGIYTYADVRPTLTPARLFPFARVRVVVTRAGRRVRTRSLVPGDDTVLRLRPGTYRITATYPGDRWRTRSTARKVVRIRSCRRV